jgi:hypothetical protein
MLVELMQLFNTIQSIQNCHSVSVDTEKGCYCKFIQSHLYAWTIKKLEHIYITHSTYHNTIKVQFEDVRGE